MVLNYKAKFKEMGKVYKEQKISKKFETNEVQKSSARIALGWVGLRSDLVKPGLKTHGLNPDQYQIHSENWVKSGFLNPCQPQLDPACALPWSNPGWLPGLPHTTELDVTQPIELSPMKTAKPNSTSPFSISLQTQNPPPIPSILPVGYCYLSPSQWHKGIPASMPLPSPQQRLNNDASQ